jgi:NADH-quinone oxidoreductase subunit H
MGCVARSLGLAVFGLLVTPGLSGCDRAPGPELITLSRVVPDRVEVGERVDIVGIDLPVGDALGARIVFDGSLHRAGRESWNDREIVVRHVELHRERASFLLDDELAEVFVGRGDEARHTTFRGRVSLHVPGDRDGVEVHGTVRGEVVLDLVPRPPRQALVDERSEEAERAVGYLGLGIDDSAGGSGGVVVKRVSPESPAAKAKLEPDDRIVSFDGLRVQAAEDLVPSGKRRTATLQVLRGEQRLVVPVDVSGFRSAGATELLGAVVVLGTIALVLFALGGPLGPMFTWLVHRLRLGHSRSVRAGASPFARVVGLVRSVAHGSAAAPSGLLARATPYLVLLGISVSFAAIPLVELRRRAELDLGVLYLLSVTSLLTMGLLTGGWHTKGSRIRRGVRAALDVVWCELPAAAALLAVVLRSGSLRVRDLVLGQVGPSGTTLETGSWPWYWNALQSPQLFAAFALFFVAVMVEPGEPAAGERSRASVGRAAFFLAEWANVFIMCGLGTAVFLGGYYLPGVSAHEHHASIGLQVAGTLFFLIKAWSVVLLVLLARASLPKIRVDLLMRLGLRWFAPLSAVALGLALVEARWPLLPSARIALGALTFSAAVALAAILTLAVWRGGPTRMARARVNPFL